MHTFLFLLIIILNHSKKGDKMKKLIPFLVLLFTVSLQPQTDTVLTQQIESIIKYNESLEHRLDVLEKTIDDVLWFQRVGDVAFIDKVYMTGPPKWKELNPTGQGAGNPVKFWSYVFIPKGLDYSKKYPLIVFRPHRQICS